MRVTTSCLPMLLLAFAGCTNSSSSSSLDSSVNCTTSNCITPAANSLSLTPTLDSTGQKIVNGPVAFNLAGDCNEGGFAYNQVQWTLHNGSGPARVSTQVVYKQGSSEFIVIDSCKNGRFEIQVSFAPGTVSVQPNSYVTVTLFAQTAPQQPFTGSQASAHVDIGTTR